MIWQLNEAFPNVSSTALIDFYNKPRPVYYAIKQSFDKVVPSFQYDKLLFKEGEKTAYSAFVTLEEESECEVRLTVADGEKTREILAFDGVLPAGTTVLKTDKVAMSQDYIHLVLTVTVDKKEHRKEALLMKRQATGFVNKGAIVPIMQAVCAVDG